MKLQVESLFPFFDDMQKQHGDKSLNAIYGAGCIKNPDLMMIFMNPTAKNISSSKDWAGIRAPWLGTKNVWKILFGIGRLSKVTFFKTQKMTVDGWTEKFCEQIYSEMGKNRIYVTNLSKSTQLDARHLPDKHYRGYLELLIKEIEIVKPRKVVSFGNQVSSILLNRQIKISSMERKFGLLELTGGKSMKIYPIYYPVGQGMRNMRKSISLISMILD